MTIDTLRHIFEYISVISSIISAIVLIVKPLREKLFNIKKQDDASCCLMRNEITKIYYHNLEKRTLREYEFKNLEDLYNGYHSLGGNHFIDTIYKEMQTWKIVPN